MSSSTSRQQVDNLVSHLRTAKSIHEEFLDTVRSSILLQGRTLEDWQRYFSLEFPQNPDINHCKQLDIKLMELHQEASFLKVISEAAFTLGKRGFDAQYRNRFTALVSEFKLQDKKLPAKETLEILAAQEFSDVETSLSYSEVAVKFWKDILEDLNFKRRTLESIVMAEGITVKANLGSNFLQNKKDHHDY